jgi:hypothetical protein
MRLNSLLFLSVGLGAFACGGGDAKDDTSSQETGDTDEIGDTEDTETGEPLSPEEQQAVDAYNAFRDGLAEADLTDAEAMSLWAQASAPMVFVQALLPSLLVSDQISRWQAAGNAGVPDCPVLTGYDENGQATGMETSAEGGCTDHDGTQWLGRTSQYMAGSTVILLNERFGTSTPSDVCMGKNDDFTIHSYAVWSFAEDGDSDSMDLLSALNTTTHDPNKSCESVEEGSALKVVLDRSTVELESGGEETTWSHVGQASFKSADRSGNLDIETVDEVTNDTICETEAISGDTFFTTSAHEAVIHYDGGTDCSEESTVTWTLDGADQGELSGISCSSTTRGRSMLNTVLGLSLLLVFRRRD